MIITVSKEKLKEVIDIVNNICPKKSDINVLNYFYLEAKNNEVYIMATDLEINYQTKFPARIQKEGKILIPAKQFEKIVDNLYEDDVTLETKDDVLFIRGKKFFLSLPGLSQEDFPTFSTINKDVYMEIDNEIFSAFLERLYPILKTSDIRPEYAGVYFDFLPQGLNLVVTDTIRLGVQKVKPIYYETNFENGGILLPQRIIKEYKNIKRKTGKLRIYFEENQITFEIMNHVLTSKVIAVDYPDYKSYLNPSSFLFTVLVDKDEVIKALKLSGIYTSGDLKETEIFFDFNENKLTIYSKNELLGEVKNEIGFEPKENNLDNNEFRIRFNLDFLYDGFDAFDSEKILVSFFNTGEENFPLYLVSPIEDDYVYISLHL
ncbi:MAG: DNA polymerase III subunit beta [Patescibacteria group bacterium]